MSLIFLDSIYKWDPTVFIFLHLNYFTLPNATVLSASKLVLYGLSRVSLESLPKIPSGYWVSLALELRARVGIGIIGMIARYFVGVSALELWRSFAQYIHIAPREVMGEMAGFLPTNSQVKASCSEKTLAIQKSPSAPLMFVGGFSSLCLCFIYIYNLSCWIGKL